MNPLLDKSPKQKLTLTIAKDVIFRAREAGVNISSITEKMLTVIAFSEKNGYILPAILQAYEGIFKYIGDLLATYGADYIEVGIHPGVVASNGTRYTDVPILFGEYIGFHAAEISDDDGGPIQYELDEIYDYLHPILHILENLFKSLTAAAQVNKEKIIELRFALSLVETLSREKGNENGL